MRMCVCVRVTPCEFSTHIYRINDYDFEEDKYMAISLHYRGDVKNKEVNETIEWLKNTKKCTFVEWCPTGFKIGLNKRSPVLAENDDIDTPIRNVTMIGNNTCISRVFTDRISKKYDLMYAQRAFVHWYVGEGMEEGEFEEARENLQVLANEYLDILMQETDDDDDDNEDDFENKKYYFAPKETPDSDSSGDGSPCPDLHRNLTSFMRFK